MRQDTESNENALLGIAGDWRPPKPPHGMALTLVLTFITLLLAYLLFQYLKHLIYPDITLWESHIITNVASSIAGTIAMYVVLRHQIQNYRQLQAFEARNRTLIYISPIAIALATLDGTIIMCNALAAHIQGYRDPAELVGRSAYEFFAPEEHERVRANLQKTIEQGSLRDIQYTLVKADGTRFPAEVSAAIMPDARGNPALLVGIINDISERMQAQEQIRRLLERVELRAAEMDATITAMPDGVIIYGPGGEISRINRAAEELLGYNEEIESRPLPERLSSFRMATADGTLLALEEYPYLRALRGEVMKGLLFTFTRGDGEQRTISVSAAPIRSKDGDLLGAVVTMSDVTTLRRLQQQQEDLLHIVSHDLRLPLTVIRGYIQLLAETLEQHGIDGEVYASVNSINRNVRQMDVMIKDLVDMARLQGHQMRLSLSEIALQRYIPDLLTRLRQILPVQRVVLDIPTDLPPIMADDSRLERVLLNLLTNAFKYSPADTTVRIAAYPHDREVVIDITDQGKGIAPDRLPHIFERFSHAKEERTTESVGLGLYITKLLVEAHGGRVWVESTLGKGSTFFCSFPMASAAAQNTATS